MSYNITSIKYENLDLKVPLTFVLDRDVVGNIWYKELKVDNNVFKLCFDDDGTEMEGNMVDENTIEITGFEASSSYSYDTPISEIIINLCKKYKGTVKMITVWEGGDSIERIEIEKGRVINEEAL